MRVTWDEVMRCLRLIGACDEACVAANRARLDGLTPKQFWLSARIGSGWLVYISQAFEIRGYIDGPSFEEDLYDSLSEVDLIKEERCAVPWPVLSEAIVVCCEMGGRPA